MYATLTTKGQLTLPKEIRERLGLDAGAILDFQLQPDNTITARHVQADARRIRGLLKSPHAVPLTVEQMDEAVAQHLRDKHVPARSARKWAGQWSASTPTSCCVLAEAVWTLRSAFEQDKVAQLLALKSLLDETAFAFEDREAIVQAVALFESGSCGFADCWVVAKHGRHGCDFTATFDRGMRKLPGFKIL